MLGWLEWDEANQRLRVVIPPWNCVDGPRLSPGDAKAKTAEVMDLVKDMKLSQKLRVSIRNSLGSAIVWLSEDLFEFALETLVMYANLNPSLFDKRAEFGKLINPPFNDLIAAKVDCTKQIEDLQTVALLLTSTTRRVFLNDLVSRAREKLHDDHSVVAPHASINQCLNRLDSMLLIASPGLPDPTGGALIPANADQQNTQIRRLVRRLLFSMDCKFHRDVLVRFEALVKANRVGVVHRVAQRVEQLGAQFPLFSLCEALYMKLNEVLNCQDPRQLADEATLADDVFSRAAMWIEGCTGITYRLTRGYLISLGDARPLSPQLQRSHDLLTQQSGLSAALRIARRKRWLLGQVPAVPALTLTADPAAATTDDPVHAWPVDRIVRWINGPVTGKNAGKALSDPETLAARDKLLLNNDRKRSGAEVPNKPEEEDLALTEIQAKEIVWQGLIQSAEYLRDDLRDLGSLADSLGVKGKEREAAVDVLRSLEQALADIQSTKRKLNVAAAQMRLVLADSCAETLRAAIKPVKAATDRLLKFGECLSQRLLEEALIVGKRHGGVIGCPMPLDQWAAVRDRYHQRYCSVVQTVFMDESRVLLSSDQALALHVTGSSQSGYAFDVSVHLWQRYDESKDDPFDMESTEAFPKMNTRGWFDTFQTCAVLHVERL